MNRDKIRLFAIVGILVTVLMVLSTYAFTNANFDMKANKYKQKPKSGLGYVRTGRVEYKAPDIFFLGDFTTNMATNDKAGKFVRVEVRLKMGDEDMVDELKFKNIVLRDAVIEELSLKRFSQVSTEKGKILLKNNLKDRLNTILVDGEVKEVYFTKFIIQ